MFQLWQIIGMDFGLQQTPKTPRQRSNRIPPGICQLIPQTNNKQSNAHSHVVRIHHNRGRCNQRYVSERNLENRKHNSRRVATLLPRDGLAKSQNVPHIGRIGNPVSIHFHESKLTRRNPTPRRSSVGRPKGLSTTV